jgi:hypothetical protein
MASAGSKQWVGSASDRQEMVILEKCLVHDLSFFGPESWTYNPDFIYITPPQRLRSKVMPFINSRKMCYDLGAVLEFRCTDDFYVGLHTEQETYDPPLRHPLPNKVAWYGEPGCVFRAGMIDLHPKPLDTYPVIEALAQLGERYATWFHASFECKSVGVLITEYESDREYYDWNRHGPDPSSASGPIVELVIRGQRTISMTPKFRGQRLRDGSCDMMPSVHEPDWARTFQRILMDGEAAIVARGDFRSFEYKMAGSEACYCGRYQCDCRNYLRGFSPCSVVTIFSDVRLTALLPSPTLPSSPVLAEQRQVRRVLTRLVNSVCQIVAIESHVQRAFPGASANEGDAAAAAAEAGPSGSGGGVVGGGEDEAEAENEVEHCRRSCGCHDSSNCSCTDNSSCIMSGSR